MQVWRICGSRYAHAAFSGDGSLLLQGRWHNEVRVVYTATSIALACIEVFVNINRHAEPRDFACAGAHIPDSIEPERVEESGLPEGWREDPATCGEIGMEWLESGRGVALLVPSAAVMGDWNVLLNPVHKDFPRITVGEAKPFRFDARMFRRA